MIENQITHTPIHRIEDRSAADDLRERITENEKITAWYHQIDLRLAEHMGTPELPSWARFAKHASYSAGIQLRNMLEVMEAVDAVQQVTSENSEVSIFNPIASLKTISQAVREVGDLFRHKDLFQTVLLLGAMRAGADKSAIDAALDRATRDGNSGISLGFSLMNAIPRFPTILSSLPEIRAELLLVYNVVADTNSHIYEFMAPRLEHFLHCAQSGEVADVCNEPSGKFLSCALRLYDEARAISQQLQDSDLSETQRNSLMNHRIEKVVEANILATFGEQLYRVEPGFSRLTDLFDSLIAFMSYQTPGMEQRLAGESSVINWGVLYERMGIDASSAPLNPQEITPESFPTLLPSDHPCFQGTIAQVLIRGTLDPDLSILLRSAPEKIKPTQQWGSK